MHHWTVRSRRARSLLRVSLQMVLGPVQRGLDGVLLGMIGAQARAQQAMDAFDVGLYGGRIAADDAPSDAPAGREIIFR